MKAPNQLSILEQLFRTKNVYTLLYNLKTLSFSNSTKKIKQALKHPVALKTIFHKSSLPKEYSQLRENKVLGFSGNLEGELAWSVQSLSKYSDLINKFTELNLVFEKAILLDDNKTGLGVLKRIDDEICKSYWGIENLFSTIQNLEGDEGNWALLQELNSKTKDYYTLFFNGTFSKKAESGITLLQYKRDIEAEMNTLSGDDSEYLLFKLGYFFVEDYTQYAYITFTENASSIIDRYLTIIDVVFEISNIESHTTLVAEVINELEVLGIKDLRIKRLKEISGIENDFKINDELFEILDSYTIGDYSNVIINIKNFLKENPDCIEVYDIYIKSLVEQNRDFEKTNVSTIIDNILENLFSIYKRDVNYYTSRENLLKIYLAFPKINFFKRLLGLVSDLTGIKSTKDVFSNSFYVYSRFSNPSIIIAKKKLKNYYNHNIYLKEHASFKVNQSIAHNDFSEISKMNIPDNKINLYKARGSFFNDNYFDSINILENLLLEKELKVYIEEEAIQLLFYSYLFEKHYDKAVSLFVDSFFKNKFLVERLNADLLYNFILQNDYNLATSIDLPIFFYLNNANSYQKYVSLEIYLEHINVDKPSEIGNEIVENEKSLFLLEKICDLKVLNYFYSVFLNDNEVIEERKDILRKLTSVDKSKSNIYLEELASITQKEKIKSIIQVVNDGKIKLNFSRIKDNKDINLENNFNRFVKFREFAKENNLTVLDTQILIENYLSELTSDSSKLQDASFVQFKSVYFEVVEHFLFSEEHGLDGDISTRIRHGVLENQIRKIFLNTNLIALKNKKGNYEDIEYWNEYGENDGYLNEVILKFQEVLKKFSKSIDDKIDYIINEQMQVFSNRYRKKKKGLFNYYFTEEYLWILYKDITENIQDYDAFMNTSFDILKDHTDLLLINIKDYFRDTLNIEFNSYMEELEGDIKELFPVQAPIFSELFQVINNTKFLIQKELDLISEWFKISNPILDYTLDVKTIIETSVESINLIHAKNKINANINDSSDLLLQGFDYYIIIFGILFENIIKHSGIESSEIDVEVITGSELVRIEKNDLTSFHVSIKNEVCNVDEDFLREVFETIKENWSNKLYKVNTEGGSGFNKIKRILKYDIKCFDSIFDYSITGNNLMLSLKIFSFYKNFDDE